MRGLVNFDTEVVNFEAGLTGYYHTLIVSDYEQEVSSKIEKHGIIRYVWSSCRTARVLSNKSIPTFITQFSNLLSDVSIVFLSVRIKNSKKNQIKSFVG